MEKRKALVFGASGLIGGHLLQFLLENPVYEQVCVAVRKPLADEHPKLRQIIVDFHSLVAIKDQLVGDDVFSCLGSTRKKTPDLSTYYQIDHDYPLAVARIAKENGTSAFHLVSSVGANPESSNFYLKMKGEIERDIVAIGFKRTAIYRPSLLTGKRPEKRLLEKLAEGLMVVINPLLLGGLKQYRSIPAASVAKAMNNTATKSNDGVHIYFSEDIKNLQ